MERELSFQYDGLFEIDQYGEGSMMFSFASEIRGYPPSVSYVSTEEYIPDSRHLVSYDDLVVESNHTFVEHSITFLE